MQHPNILFIQADQLSAAALPAYGNSFCFAPHLQQLAAHGALFETAYCNFPLCAPSRFSMATGQLCSAIGAYDNAAELPASTPTYAHYLRALGYQTALSGKMHFIGPDQHHGFETRLTAELYPADFSWSPFWGDEGKRDTNDARSVRVAGPCARSVQIDYDDEVTAKAVQHLYDIARGADERPFFMQVSYTHPHEPYLCLAKYWDEYDGVDIPPPAVGALPVAEHDAHSLRLLRDFGMLDVVFSDAEIQRARRAYYGSVSYIDAQVGRLLDTLAAAGMRERTAVVFTSDHGDMLGERGLWFKKHFYEGALRVPLLLSAPWLGAQRIAAPVSLVDILPTLCGLASGGGWAHADDAVEPLAGIDLSALLQRTDTTTVDTTATERTIYAEYLAEAALAPIFMLRRGRYKYIASTADPALLFDVATDPTEQHNLATNPDCAQLAAQFAAEVETKWDSAALTADIITSQKRRRLIRQAHRNGVAPRWDGDGDDSRWYRGKGSYNQWAFDYLPVAGGDLAANE